MGTTKQNGTETGPERVSEPTSAIAIYRYRTSIERAIQGLQQAGVTTTRLSVLGRAHDTEEYGAGDFGTVETCLTEPGDSRNALWGLLSDVEVLSVPGIGRVMAAGPVARALEAGMESECAFGGLTALGAVLFSLNIPRDSAFRYEIAVMADSFLLLVHGSDAETESASDALETTDAEEVALCGRKVAGVQ